MQLAGQWRFLLSSAAVYYVLAICGIYLFRQPGNIATLWFANAAAVIAMQMRPMATWPSALLAIGAAMLAANLSFGDPFLMSASFVPGNLCEILLGAYLLKRYGKISECLVDPIQLVKTLSFSALLPSLLGAVLGAATLAAYGLAPFSRVWPAWAIGSTIGSVSILPIGFLLLQRGLPAFRSRIDVTTTLPINLLVVATALYAPLYLPYPFVYVSASLIFVAVIGGLEGLAIALPVSTVSLGVLIALGQFLPPPSTSEFGELVFYLPFIITMLPPLIAAVAFHRVELVNAQLADSESNYRDLYENTPVMMHSLNTTGQIVSVSEAWLAKLGYTREEVLGKNTLDFLTPESQNYARDVVLPKFDREGWVKDIDYEMVCKSGEIIDVRFSAIWETDFAGKRVKKLAVIIDVTEEKRLASTLEEEKTRLAAILDGTDVGTWEWNIATGESRFNNSWYAMLGYAPDDTDIAAMAGWQSLVHPADLELCQTLLSRHFRGEDARFSQELRLRHRQGHWIYVLARGKVGAWAQEGHPTWMYGTHLDIGDIKRAQQAAEEGKIFLERISQIAGVGAWSVDLINQNITWSAQTCRIHEVPVGHRPTFEEAVGYYAPESKLRVEAAVEHAVATKQGWDLELQMITAKGRNIWTRAVGEVELDDVGHPVRLVGAFQDITARKSSDAELNRLHALVGSVLRSASEMSIIATDLQGVIQVFNAGAERMLGYSAVEMVGKQTPAVLHLAEEVIARGQELSQEYGTPIEGFRVFVHKPELGQAEARQWTYVRKDGSRLQVWLVATAMYDAAGNLTGYLGIATDISRRLADQRALADTAEQLKLAIEVAEMGIWTWDPGTNQLHWNDRMYELYDLPESLRGDGLYYEHWRSKLHPDDLEATEASLLAAVEGKGVYDPVFRIATSEGGLRHIQAAAQIERDSSGKAVRVIGINRDITDQLLLESSLRKAKEQADLASSSKSSFLANMSHEIRTPMNAVLGMLQLVKRTELDPRQQDYIDKADVAAKSLLGLLNDILDFSKVEAGKMDLDPHPFELEQLLRDLAVVLSGNVGAKDLELLFEVDPTLPRVLMADRMRLQQVLINLAGNAIKFTTKGEVVISFQRLISVDNSVTIKVSVRDSGIGISPSQLEHIFEGFSQAEASTTRRFGGTGLGLAISRRLVSLMGGDLTVTSKIDSGSQFSFTVTLPIADDQPLVQAMVTNTPLRLLVVDDNPIARDILRHYCDDLGWACEEASSGQEAIAKVERSIQSAQQFSAVLMDWRMPEMDGLVAAERIRAISSGETSPIILMVSAYGREVLQDSQKLQSAPFAEFLTKPLTPNQLSEALNRALAGDRVALPLHRAKPLAKRLSGLKLLVVEDNAINRQIAYELLSAEGAEVVMAESGLPGVEMACDRSNQFDLVLMDIQMPDIDGLEATRRIRKRLAGARLPILAMTANASAADRDECFVAGMDEHVGKPIDIDELVAVILKLLGLQATGAAVTRSTGAVALGVDSALQAALKRFSGNTALLETTLVALLPEGTKLIDMAHAATSQKELTLPLHTLKGIAATVGALSLSKYAAKIEQEIKQFTTSAVNLPQVDADELHRLLNAETAELLAAFEKYKAPKEQKSNPNQGSLSTDVLASRLQSVLPLLEGRRMQAIDMMEALLEECTGPVRQALLPLESQIQQLKFDEAAATLRSLLEEWLDDAQEQSTAG